jgi:hydrogenase expression/formation protein HypE
MTTLELLDEKISMKHGAGGRAMRALIENVFAKGFRDKKPGSITLDAMDDGAAIPIGDQWLIITTDSHVIHPIFFPGGDIGRLSISGTINDLAMMGATEVLGLTCAIVIEEDFPMASLERIHQSMLDTCLAEGVAIVTGDTKVMGKGELDGIILNTTGVGLAKRPIPDNALQPGDRIIVTGNVGDHGLAVMATRHALQLEGDLRSDVAPLISLVRDALAAAPGAIHTMKDPTRGGVSSALHEMASKSNVGIILDEPSIPISDAVRAAGELLGIDPLVVANEGKAVIGVSPEAADLVLSVIQRHPLGVNARIIGTAVKERAGSVIIDTGFGRRLLAESEGEPLPRIC